MKVHERVLITGAEGLLGRYFTAQLTGRCSLVAHNHASLDITNAKAVAGLSRTVDRFATVVHTLTLHYLRAAWFLAAAALEASAS